MNIYIKLSLHFVIVTFDPALKSVDAAQFLLHMRKIKMLRNRSILCSYRLSFSDTRALSLTYRNLNSLKMFIGRFIIKVKVHRDSYILHSVNITWDSSVSAC